MAIESLPSGMLRAAVRHGGRKMANKAVKTRSEAKVLEAELMMEMAAEPAHVHFLGLTDELNVLGDGSLPG